MSKSYLLNIFIPSPVILTELSLSARNHYQVRSPSPGASISHTNPMRQFARIFLILLTVGLLDWRTLYAIQYNIIQYDTAQHNTTQHKTIQYSALYNMFSFFLSWVKNCSKNRKMCAQVDSRIYGRWRLRVMGSLPSIFEAISGWLSKVRHWYDMCNENIETK